jgi:hypothetical protein
MGELAVDLWVGAGLYGGVVLRVLVELSDGTDDLCDENDYEVVEELIFFGNEKRSERRDSMDSPGRRRTRMGTRK